jgi:hypothetical protein
VFHFSPFLADKSLGGEGKAVTVGFVNGMSISASISYFCIKIKKKAKKSAKRRSPLTNCPRCGILREKEMRSAVGAVSPMRQRGG